VTSQASWVIIGGNVSSTLLARAGCGVVLAAVALGSGLFGTAAQAATRPTTTSSATSTSTTSSIDPALGYDPADTGSMNYVTDLLGARALWSAGVTGKGVDVALIDTGVSPVPGLNSGNVVNGPDLSFTAQTASARYVDGYGHGTHMASIIVGRDGASTPAGYAKSTGFTGLAPDARLINVKVGAADGTVDVSQVIAGINWVTAHAHDNGLNIRVLNLSFGTDSLQGYETDPLAYAVEAAWRKGILVVVAAGNDGTSKQDLADPAMDPNVLAVGAEDPMQTATTLDDTIPDFSDRGTTKRGVDLVAPGTHIIGLRVPGSAVDSVIPAVKVGTRFVRGSGTSQAAAVTSGAAALLFSARPDLTPAQAKALLAYVTTPLSKSTRKNAGAGLINAAAAVTMAKTISAAKLASLVPAQVSYGTGLGTLEGARGTAHVTHGGVTLSGERDVFNKTWVPKTWTAATLAVTTWTGGSWNGSSWTGTTWATASTAAGGALAGWAPRTTSGTAWSGEAWTAASWQLGGWDGRTWAAGGWDGRSWAAGGWDGRTWVDADWSSYGWS
jgi:serine protease AprX